MTAFYKFMLFILVFGGLLIAGYYLFHYLNKRIKESETRWQLLGFMALLFLGNAALFVGGLYLLIYAYAFLR